MGPAQVAREAELVLGQLGTDGTGSAVWLLRAGLETCFLAGLQSASNENEL